MWPQRKTSPALEWNTRAVVCDQPIVKKHHTLGCLRTRFPQVTLAFGFPLKVQPRGGERHQVGTGLPPAFAQPLVLSFLTASSLAGQPRIPKLGTLERMVRLALEAALGACAPVPHAASSQSRQTKLCTEADREASVRGAWWRHSPSGDSPCAAAVLVPASARPCLQEGCTADTGRGSWAPGSIF